MAEQAKGKIQALKDFFSVPGKPVTNQELIDFKRNDSAGFDELVELVQRQVN